MHHKQFSKVIDPIQSVIAKIFCHDPANLFDEFTLIERYKKLIVTYDCITIGFGNMDIGSNLHNQIQ